MFCWYYYAGITRIAGFSPLGSGEEGEEGGGLAAARRSDGSSDHAGESALKDASERV